MQEEGGLGGGTDGAMGANGRENQTGVAASDAVSSRLL